MCFVFINLKMNYQEIYYLKKKLNSYKNWAELDSNQRSETQRIYNPPPLTTRAPTLYTRNNNIYNIKRQD